MWLRLAFPKHLFRLLLWASKVILIFYQGARKGTNLRLRGQTEPKHRFSLIFADFCRFSPFPRKQSIWETQIFAENRWFSQDTAENRRNPQKTADWRLCPLVRPLERGPILRLFLKALEKYPWEQGKKRKTFKVIFNLWGYFKPC